MFCAFFQNPAITINQNGCSNINLVDISKIFTKNQLPHIDHPPELNSLLKILKRREITSKWYQFGSALGVPKKILDQLTDYSEEDCLVELLDYWLKNHPQQPTWKEITDAQNKICFYEFVN